MWDECKTHMEGKDRHYYPSVPHHIPASSPLYSASCFITPHHSKRRFQDRWAIPPTLTGDDGHPVFHPIINSSDGPTSNHVEPDEDLPVPDAPVDYDDPFPDQVSRALDVLAGNMDTCSGGYIQSRAMDFIRLSYDCLFSLI